MKLQRAKELVQQGEICIINDISDVELLCAVLSEEVTGTRPFYVKNDYHLYFDNVPKHLKLVGLSEIEIEVPIDVLVVVEKYGKNKLLTLIQKLN